MKNYNLDDDHYEYDPLMGKIRDDDPRIVGLVEYIESYGARSRYGNNSTLGYLDPDRPEIDPDADFACILTLTHVYITKSPVTERCMPISGKCGKLSVPDPRGMLAYAPRPQDSVVTPPPEEILIGRVDRDDPRVALLVEEVEERGAMNDYGAAIKLGYNYFGVNPEAELSCLLTPEYVYITKSPVTSYSMPISRAIGTLNGAIGTLRGTKWRGLLAYGPRPQDGK